MRMPLVRGMDSTQMTLRDGAHALGMLIHGPSTLDERKPINQGTPSLINPGTAAVSLFPSSTLLREAPLGTSEARLNPEMHTSVNGFQVLGAPQGNPTEPRGDLQGPPGMDFRLSKGTVHARHRAHAPPKWTPPAPSTPPEGHRISIRNHR